MSEWHSTATLLDERWWNHPGDATLPPVTPCVYQSCHRARLDPLWLPAEWLQKMQRLNWHIQAWPKIVATYNNSSKVMQLWVILGGFPDDDHRGQPKCKIQVIIRWLVMFSIYTLHFLGNLILTLAHLHKKNLNLQDFFPAPSHDWSCFSPFFGGQKMDQLDPWRCPH